MTRQGDNPWFCRLFDHADRLGMRVELDVGARIEPGGFRTLGPILVTHGPRTPVIVNVEPGGSLESAAEAASRALVKLAR